MSKLKPQVIYLASPYSYKNGTPQGNQLMMQWRFQKVCDIAAEWMLKGYTVFSPIAHSHPIAMSSMFDSTPVQENWEFWERQDLPILARCDMVLVACIPGWHLSRGLRAEVTKAHKLNIPVMYTRYHGFDLEVPPL